MPKVKTADGTNLYYEEAGTGTPVVFVHEFAGDYRTWEPQMRAFSRSASLRHLQPARLSAVRRARAIPPATVRISRATTSSR